MRRDKAEEEDDEDEEIRVASRPRHTLAERTMGFAGTSDDEDVQKTPEPADIVTKTTRSSARKGTGKPPGVFESRSGRTIKPVQRLVAEQHNTTQPPPTKPAPKSTQPKARTKMVVPPGYVIVADLPDVPPKSPTHWVPANVVMAKPELILPFVFSNGTKLPGNTFEELWTVEEQQRLIVEVQKQLKSIAKKNKDASTWSSLSWKKTGVTWNSVNRPLNEYFNRVTQPMGTPLAEPDQLVGVITLERDRLFTDRTWKDCKDRAVLIWEIIAPDYVKPQPKPPQKPEGPPPDMSPARSDNSSSTLSSLQSSHDDFPGNLLRPHIATGPTKDQPAWRVDDADQAPDHQNLKPKLPRPAYTVRSEALQARFVEGGPCYICKAPESLDVWRQSLYMKVPVMKKTGVRRAVQKEDESYQKLRPEDYEVCCTDCYQRDYKSRFIAGGPCGKCGKTESCTEWYDGFFLQKPTGTLFCSNCWTVDYNARTQQLADKHNDMHDLWKGQMVDYGDGKAKDTFWAGVDKSIPMDVVTDAIFNPRNQVHSNRTSTGGVIGTSSNPAHAEGDTNATIDDETVMDSSTSFAERPQEELRFSSDPDDESGSPRIVRRRPAANASMEASISPLRRPTAHPTEAAIPDYGGSATNQSRQATIPPLGGRGHPIFGEADARRQASNQGTATIPALSGPHPGASQSRQASIPALTLPAPNQFGQPTIPPLARTAPSQNRQATIPVLRRPAANQSGAVAIPTLGGPMPIRDGAGPADPEAVSSMHFGGGEVPFDDDSDDSDWGF